MEKVILKTLEKMVVTPELNKLEKSVEAIFPITHFRSYNPNNTFLRTILENLGPYDNPEKRLENILNLRISDLLIRCRDYVVKEHTEFFVEKAVKEFANKVLNPPAPPHIDDDSPY